MGINGFAHAGFSIALAKSTESKRKKREENPSKLDNVFKKTEITSVSNPQPLNMREIRVKIAKNTHAASKLALQKFSTDNIAERLKDVVKKLGPAAYDRDDERCFALQIATTCLDIINILEKPKDEITPEQMQSVREKLSKALRSYKENKGELEEGNLKLHVETAIDFLDCLAFHIRTQAEGMQVLEDIGTHARVSWLAKPSEDPIDAKRLADDVETVFHNMPADNWDSAKNCLIWALKNIAEAFFAFIDNRIPGCQDVYNSYDNGNTDMFYGDFEVSGKKIRTHIGPGPRNDLALVNAQLRWQEKKGIPHVINTLEFNHKLGEKSGLGSVRDLVDANKTTLPTSDPTKPQMPAVAVVANPMDGKMAKGKKEFKDIQTVKQFHDLLRDELTGKDISAIPAKLEEYTGFAIPEHLLSKEDLEDVILFSESTFERALGTENLNPYNDKKQNARLCSAMLTSFNGFLAIKIMTNLGKLLPNAKDGQISATLERVCKQCADRGPVANAVVIAFTRLIEKGQINDTDQKQIIGLLTGRSMIASPDRKMVKNRRDTFTDLFKIIGQNKETQQAFVTALKCLVGIDNEGNPYPIHFVPSNQGG